VEATAIARRLKQEFGDKTWMDDVSIAPLQEELVAHAHDLVKRIDLVLSHSERGRLGLEATLADVRARLAQLEAKTKHG